MTEELMKQRQACDDQIGAALERLEEQGIPFHVMLDRLLTIAAAQACINFGREDTVRQIRHMADRIDAGMFNHLTGEPDKVSGNA